MSAAIAVALGAGAAVLCNATPLDATARPMATTHSPLRTETTMQQHPYIGMWVTRDGQIRQALLANGRYDEARHARQSAYQGRYEVTGNTIHYWDDSGFTADGRFVGADELHHGGMVFYRQRAD
ncbi:Atu4866 domain-containing protein [Xanthomonas vesicatoria]|nr:Atu4866 domain-containing protein [Xanthomonas vesicatoria]APO97320.1 hypothetical protein BI313_11220 [Xanthomonas vesicatoria]KHM90171.1 hypothetical protein OR60_22680 [Xanthomonas vesicatoria]KHM93246.1 hypothetical protein OR61_14690 [Xanthomonas vesicatoria]KTF33593.1 hypothetical protein LMG920_09230 [Xanthomonas vesicatoria]KTF38061.1 hypothetical protein LMG919_04635 [Xanthomonas vesicatoria]